MKKQRIVELRDSFYDGLVNDTVPFWANHAVDHEMGGYTFFLDRKGRASVHRQGNVDPRKGDLALCAALQ